MGYLENAISEARQLCRDHPTWRHSADQIEAATLELANIEGVDLHDRAQARAFVLALLLAWRRAETTRQQQQVRLFADSLLRTLFIGTHSLADDHQRTP